MNLITQILQIVIASLLIVLAVNAIYLLLFSVAGKFYKDKPASAIQTQKKFLVLIPGYKEDAVIVQSARSVVQQNYPAQLFDCVVIADSFEQKTIEAIKQTGALVHEMPADEKRSKAKSIQHFLGNCFTDYDVCVVLDADNIIEADALAKANVYFNSSVQILQANRIAKNENNNLARLDALSETINNHIFRKGQRALGLSASLIGSGMFIQMNIFRMVMEDMNVFSGFDKEMELRILKNKLTIDYASNIPVYDEKVSQQSVFVNQRRRWIFAQLFFLKKNVFNALHQLIIHGNVDYFNKVLQFALLPRVLCLGLSAVIIPIALIAGTNYFYAATIICMATVTALFIPVKENLQATELLKLSIQLPSVIKGMLQAIFTSKQASGKFIHTPHNI